MLVDYMFTRDQFYGMMQGFAQNMMGSMAPPPDELEEEELQAFQQFQDAFTKEFLWLFDGRYAEFRAMVQEALDEAYTPEEQAILKEIYKEHPWIADKAGQVGVTVSRLSIPLGQEIGKQTIKNLQETDEFAWLRDNDD